jgi:hypothetical protein
VREIPLSQGKVALVDDEDYEQLAQHKWHAAKSRTKWYASRNVGHLGDGCEQGKLAMHQAIMGTRDGVDHIDGDGLNNQRSNLRRATQAQNVCNARRRSDNTSGFKGVSWNPQSKAWRADIMVGGRRHYLGKFATREEAAEAYAAAVSPYHGEFGRTG